MDPRSSFNAIAALYDKARPDYPDAVFDDIRAASALTAGDPVLEVGCGSGQATIGFARRGLAVTAVDPGPDLLRLARQRLDGFGNVAFVESSFEAWPPPAAAFKLVASAQAWHWIAPDIGYAKAASLLAPGGMIAVFGNVPAAAAPPFDQELPRLYEHELGAPLGPPPEIWYTPMGALPQLIAKSGHFAPPIHKSHAWSRLHSAASFTDFLRTRTDHRRLPPRQLEKLLAAIADAIVAHGGQIELRFETHLHLARKA
jgi:SAM-dependent methyltransferase